MFNNKKEIKLISHGPTKFIPINSMASGHTTCGQNFQTNHIVQDQPHLNNHTNTS